MIVFPSEEAQRRVAQDEHDELVAYRLTAGGLDQLATLLTVFAQELHARDAGAPDFWPNVRKSAALLEKAVPALAALTSAESPTMTKGQVLTIVKRAIVELHAGAERLRVTEAGREAIARDMALVPTSPQMDKVMRYRAELIREMKVVLKELEPYRRQQQAKPA